jgi:hypothetical protein
MIVYCVFKFVVFIPLFFYGISKGNKSDWCVISPALFFGGVGSVLSIIGFCFSTQTFIGVLYNPEYYAALKLITFTGTK